MAEERTTQDQVPITPPGSQPGLVHNYISFAGIAIAVTSLVCIVLLVLLELSGGTENPYTDLITFIFLPSILVFGLFIVLVGVIIERRRRRDRAPGETARYPVLDLNEPRRRRSLLMMICLAFAFMFMSAFGSYRAYEYTESVVFCGQACHSVMQPEFVAYNASPHARVRCVECHVGGGAEAYVRSKFTGMRQLYGVITGHYNRPIKTPVHNMRAATETCMKCHWNEKYHGDELMTFSHYGYDEQSSPKQTRMLLKVGGGDPTFGPVGGIHWHMNVANEITFIANDEQRQDIPWVQMKDANGRVTEFRRKDAASMTAEQIERSAKRRMDCIDCHNRPTHIYLSPNQAVDRSLDAGRLDRSLPFIKAKAVEVLAKTYSTHDEAIAAISADLNAYYKGVPGVLPDKLNSVGAAVAEVQLIYSTYFFPEMKTDWRAHPNNIGHLNGQGCFRCHDGQHFGPEGKVIRNECSVCHTTLDQTFAGKTFSPPNGVFQHPVDLGDRNTWQCATCHKGDRPFVHPLNLGDISRFQCAECHKAPGQAAFY